MAGRAAPSDYAALVGRLVAARRSGVRFELERVAALLARLGHPERRMGLVVQIGGTNGKGSTAAFTEAVLRAAGLRTGLYTSPHLSRYRERFRVDGAELAEATIAELGADVLAADPAGGLTFFELTTAIGILGFARAGVDVAVLEVGMGGRLDATTAAGAPIAAVTGVALDHQAYLGGSLAEIAAEKAGIFAAGQDAVIGAAGEPEAVPLLVAAARAAGVRRVAVIDEAAVAAVPTALGLAGPHQAGNAACALALVDAVADRRGRPIAAAERAAGLAATRFPGRLEAIVRDGQRYLVDGAHNPQAARVLGAALDERAALDARVVVLAVSSDKDAAGIAAPLCRGVRAVVVCETRSERLMSRARLATIVRARTSAPVHEEADVGAALTRAAALAGPDALVVVAGSLFLVGEAREILLDEPGDGFALDDPLRR